MTLPPSPPYVRTSFRELVLVTFFSHLFMFSPPYLYTITNDQLILVCLGTDFVLFCMFTVRALSPTHANFAMVLLIHPHTVTLIMLTICVNSLKKV